MTKNSTGRDFNVMLSCAGRRNYLIGFFRDALGARGRVFAGDMSVESAAMIEAGRDAVELPAVAAPNYFDALLKACVERNVRLLISLNDFELPGLARNMERFREAGVTAAVSSPAAVDLCFDKYATYKRLKAWKIPTPETFLGLTAGKAALKSGALRFPLVVKPRWGSASVCVEIVRNLSELEAAYAWTRMKLVNTAIGQVGGAAIDERILIQQAVSGIEHGMDIINDLDGRHRAVIIRRKVAIRAGETDRAEIVREPRLAALAKKIGEGLGGRGLIDCDAFVTPQGPCILELNPRFGGGYPFSHAAGADVPRALIAWTEGKAVDPKWLKAKPGVLSAKCDRLVSKR